MCGIVGAFRLYGAAPSPDIVAAMNATLVHRGPDEEGSYNDEVAALAMRRLSIIGLGNGRQPLFNEDRTIAVVMNGEIYNYRELKQELEGRGHRFSTRSDVEVAVHLYEERGADFVGALRGMFAFALYDQKRRKLLLGRDRPGKKPLYYAVHRGQLFFASEIKALHAVPDLARRTDPSALLAYLSNGFVVGQRTLFEGIQKLPAGHMIEASVGQSALAARRYWDLPRPLAIAPSLDDAAQQVRTLLAEAVRVRLMSEVPLGAFLSGGVDSSAVVALMSEQLDAPVETFAVGFGDARFDELEHARAAATLYRTHHHELRLGDCDAELLAEINRHHDEPASDPAAVPTYLLSRFARQYVTVVLTGEGGDELFAGYRHHHLQARLAQLDRLPGLTPIARVLSRLEATWVAIGPRRLWKGLWIAGLDGADRPRGLVSVHTDREARRLLRREWWPEGTPYHVSAFRQICATVADLDAVTQSLYVDAHSQLPEQLLMKVDKMTMAASLEARCPFLDQRLVEYAAGLPSSLKRQGSDGKRVLRRALRGLVPAELLDRPKHGFEVPIRRWLLGTLSALSGDLLLSDGAAIHEYLDPGAVRALWKRVQAHDDTQSARQLWLLLNLAVWQAQQRPAAPAPVGVHGLPSRS
jgi:asparagine synthase (glutamine-hydrolysing)